MVLPEPITKLISDIRWLLFRRKLEQKARLVAWRMLANPRVIRNFGLGFDVTMEELARVFYQAQKQALQTQIEPQQFQGLQGRYGPGPLQQQQQQQAAIMQQQLQAGFMTVNEIREKEGMKPLICPGANNVVSIPSHEV